MPSDRVSIIDRSGENAHVLLNSFAGELGSEDRQYAYGVLRAVLHAVRDRLTVDDAAHLAAELPDLIRGIYYEGRDPSRTPADYRGSGPFLQRPAAEARLPGELQASLAAEAAMDVVRHHVSTGEFEHVLHALPKPVRAVVSK